MTPRANSTRRSTRLRRRLEGQNRRDGHDPGVARRLGRAGARRDRRPQRRCRHARAGCRHRRDCRQDREDPGRLAEAAAAQFSALHLDDRLPGAQGQSERHPRLGRPRRSPAISVVTPNPKTSGGARWNYLAAWGYGMKKFGGDEAKTKEFVTAIYRNVPVLDTGARGSTITFAQRGIGDVLIAWENDAFLAFRGIRQGPIRNRRAVAVHPRRTAGLDGRWQCRREGTRKAAEAYLQYLYTPPAQAIIAKNYFRPSEPRVRRPRRISRASRRSTSSRSMASSADGRRRRRLISPTAACSIRS